MERMPMVAIGSSPIAMRDADMSPPSDAFAVSALTKRYGGYTALADVSFMARPGEILGLIGPNGAGKTTLLEVAAGLLPADSGEVLWHEQTLPASRRREHIFYLPDGLRPYQDQFTAQVIGFFADVYGRSGHDIAAAIAAVGLAPALPKRVHALSKGFARRLLLTIGLLTPHPVLLMDEPFDGFDLRQTREMCEVLRRQAASGRTLVLAIHQLTDAERICHRFVLLADGRVRGAGTLDTLRIQTGLADGDLEAVFLALT
jgi:ABC-type multidrug transport system ATPase subunit